MKNIIVLVTLFTLLLTNAVSAKEGKILFIDSYHEGYPWSEGILKGATEVLSGKGEIKVVRMDTKRNLDEEFKKEAGLMVKNVIDSWKPDVVIAADDNASKYVIVPYYKNTSLPFVFCGVNWEASTYGFPYKNVTGMLEVALIPQLIKALKEHSKGERVGLLGADNESNRKEAINYKSIFNIKLEQEVFVKTFTEWKEAYTKLQKEVDMLIIAPPSFLADSEADQKEAAKFVENNTTIPTGFVEDWIAPYAMMGYTKISEEQGRWAAQTAIEILNGKSPESIPIVRNKEGKLFLNLKIAQKMGIRFPMNMITRAELIK